MWPSEETEKQIILVTVLVERQTWISEQENGLLIICSFCIQGNRTCSTFFLNNQDYTKEIPDLYHQFLLLMKLPGKALNIG